MLAKNVVPDGGQPLFRYYAYARGAAAARRSQLVNPVAAADPGAIAQIELAFVAQAAPRDRLATRASITMRDDVFVRSANPNDPAPYPICA